MEDYCVVCERPFTPELLCCCDFATNDDGSHEGGVCVECCGQHARGRSPSASGYERADCDQ